MSKLEAITPNVCIRGILPDHHVIVVSVQWFGSDALELAHKHATGKVSNQLLYRYDEDKLSFVEDEQPWNFEGVGALFMQLSEVQRIRLAYLFDPMLVVHTSVVEPLLHQITAVYEEMLLHQPFRFLLADESGAAKNIMAGLLIKELLAREDLQRCLVVCLGSLSGQWQDDLFQRFKLPFGILTKDKLEDSRTENWFMESDIVIARLNKLARDEQVQENLKAPDCRWDLVVCNKANKMGDEKEEWY